MPYNILHVLLICLLCCPPNSNVSSSRGRKYVNFIACVVGTGLQPHLTRSFLPPASAQDSTDSQEYKLGTGTKVGEIVCCRSVSKAKVSCPALPSQARNCLQKLREDISSKLDRDPGDSLHGQDTQVIGNGPGLGPDQGGGVVPGSPICLSPSGCCI